MPSLDALLFAINNTTNRFFGAALADQIIQAPTNYSSKSPLLRTNPKFSFPDEWVLEHSRGPVDIAVFAVAHCHAPDVLAQIARHDRRLAVLKALVYNANLRPVDAAIACERVEPTHRRELERLHRQTVHNAAPPVEPVEPVVPAAPVPEILTLRRTIEKVQAGLADVSLFATLLAEEVSYNRHEALSDYLLATYVGADRAIYWASIEATPAEVLAFYRPTCQKEALTTLFATLASASTTRALVPAELVQLAIDLDVELPSHPRRHEKPHPMLEDQVVDMLITHPGWLQFLTLHPISDDQFATILEREYTSNTRDLAALLHGSRERLVALLTYLDNPTIEVRGLTDYEWGFAVQCLTTADDELITTMVHHSLLSGLRPYVEGRLRLADEKATPLLPTLSRALEIYEMNPAAFAGVQNVLTVSSPALPEEYVSAIIDHIPDIAYRMLENTARAAYVYSRLLSSGATEGEVLDHVDDLKDRSLNDVVSLLTDLSN